MNRQEFEETYIEELTNDEPIKVNGLPFYPVKMKDYFRFSTGSSILKMRKDDIPDARIISMSYLEYLLDIIIDENNNPETKEQIATSFLILLMSTCLNLPPEEVKLFAKESKTGKLCLAINEVIFTSKDFDLLKTILLYQNLPKYDDTYVDPELAADLAELDRLKSKGQHGVSLEKQEISVSMGMGMSLEEVKNMTIRKFFLSVEMIEKKLEYQICRTGQASGGKFKEDIVHYLSEKEVNGIEDKVIDYGKFKNKFSPSSKIV